MKLSCAIFNSLIVQQFMNYCIEFHDGRFNIFIFNCFIFQQQLKKCPQNGHFHNDSNCTMKTHCSDIRVGKIGE